MDKKETGKGITFHNKISNNFKQLHVDGAYGGLTPKGLINLNFYAERFPIPKSIILDVTANTTTKSSDSVRGIIREYEVGVYMDLEVAQQIADFLLKRIEEFKKINTTHANSPIK